MKADRIQSLISTYRNGLLEDVLPFWVDHCVDVEHGGFMMSLNRDGSIIDTDKGMWQQGRFTWLLGELYNNVEQRDDWLALCRHGIDFIEKCGSDQSDGRMWFHLSREGKPIRKRRYAFSEAFTAIAYGEFAKASDESWAADKAVKLFHAFLEQNLNPIDPSPKYTDTRPTQNIGFPMISIAMAQQLRESIAMEDADKWIDRSIESIANHFCKPDQKVVMETVGPSGEIYDHFDGRTLNPGHAIEGAWFILHEGVHRNDQSLIKLGCDMLDWMWQRGWDKEHGGLLYYVDLDGLPVQEYWHDMKFWWPHNEAIIATLYAHLLTGDEKYERWHQLAHDWAHQHFPDRQHGEWFGYLHRDGRVSTELKGNLWKGPFHLPRQQLVCWRLLEAHMNKMRISERENKLVTG